MKALEELGQSPTAIARRMGKSHHTTIKYLRSHSDIFDDPEIKSLIEFIKEKEVSDLYLLGGKARKRLHELLDEGKMKAIETTAVMDRTFQQRRLLEGQSTQNIEVINREHEEIRKQCEAIEKKILERTGKTPKELIGAILNTRELGD